jgi:hypothetical protein
MVTTTLRNLIHREGRDSFNFCVFDGVRQAKQICEDITSILVNNLKSNTKIIKITSLEFDVKGGDSTGGIHGIDCFFVGSSWGLADYKLAVKEQALQPDEFKLAFCIDSDFKDAEDGEDGKEREENEIPDEWLSSLVERKFFYAGGSARFMFEYSLSQLIITTADDSPSVFGRLYERMTQDHWRSFAELKISSSTSSSVSSLLQRVKGKIIPVSEYVLLVAHKKCKATLTRSVRAAADAGGNPALKGWAFELEQLDAIESLINNDSKSIMSEDRAMILPIGSNKTTTYDGVSIGDTSGDAFTIWCSKWNQGCFDVAFFVNSKLITLNFTISDKHSLKINLFVT